MMDKKYTLLEVIERLSLTDEEVLLCKQHKEYNKKLDDMLDARDFRVSVNSIGDLVDEPMEMWSWYKSQQKQQDVQMGRYNIGEPPE